MGIGRRGRWRCFRRIGVKRWWMTARSSGLRLSELRLCRPRRWGACWLALKLWQELQLDRFWAARLPASRKRTRWDQVLLVLVAYRLIEPGSEWRLHRAWFGRSALGDLLGADCSPTAAHKLYACHDLLVAHEQELFRLRRLTRNATCTRPHSHQARLPLSLMPGRSATAALRPIVAIEPRLR
jgi:hypothetical protein